jgi:23S rRNA (adenine2503-C2)-methyltransferase
MRTLPTGARRHLEESYTFSTVTAHLRREADRGLTVKYLFKLPDQRTIETVVMHYEATERSRRRTTICVSSQVGCPIGCSFCATGQSGFDRNLSEAEIVDQFLHAARELKEADRALTNGRHGKADEEYRDGEDESSQRPCDADIEERFPVDKRRLEPDYRTHRPNGTY